MASGATYSRVLGLVLVATVAGCTSLLGDFSVGPGGGPDATTDANAAEAGFDDGGADAAADALEDATVDAPVEATSDAPSDAPLATDADAGPSCGPATCPAGCCDSAGACVPFASQMSSNCGNGGAQCRGCDPGSTCSNGACTCGGGACTGCCNAGSCVAVGSESFTSCGANGVACAACQTGQSCDTSGASTGGQCICDANSCPNGCCLGGKTGTCVPWASQSSTSCGTGGAACSACSNGLCDTTDGTCSCNAHTCPSGCCASGGTCDAYSSQTASACGTGGAACGACNPAVANGCSAGSCACNGGATCSGQACCSSGCVDLQTDSKNCGACGFDCLGGTCAGGVCQPWVLSLSGVNAWSVATDGTNVYWGDYDGSVMQVPAAGGTPITLASVAANSGINRVVYASGKVLYLSKTAKVLGVATAGTAGSGTTLQSGMSIVDATMDAAVTHYYYAYTSGSPPSTVSYFVSCPFAGGSCQSQYGYDVDNLVADGTYVFGDKYLPTPANLLSELVSSGAETTTPWSAGFGGLAVDGTGLYFDYVSGSAYPLYRTGEASPSLATDAGSPPTLLAANGYPFTTNGTSVFYFNAGVLQSVPTTGGAVTTLVNNPASFDDAETNTSISASGHLLVFIDTVGSNPPYGIAAVVVR